MNYAYENNVASSPPEDEDLPVLFSSGNPTHINGEMLPHLQLTKSAQMIPPDPWESGVPIHLAKSQSFPLTSNQYVESDFQSLRHHPNGVKPRPEVAEIGLGVAIDHLKDLLVGHPQEILPIRSFPLGKTYDGCRLKFLLLTTSINCSRYWSIKLCATVSVSLSA